MDNNSIEVFNFDNTLTVQDNIKKFVASKIALKKALKNMEAIEEVYADELEEAGQLLHITRDGETLFISEMKDQHLLNTIKLFVSRGYSFDNAGVKKYVDEAKKRGMSTQLIEIVKARRDTSDHLEYEEEDDFDADIIIDD